MTANQALDRTAMSAVSGRRAKSRPAEALMTVGQLGLYEFSFRCPGSPRMGRDDSGAWL